MKARYVVVDVLPSVDDALLDLLGNLNGGTLSDPQASQLLGPPLVQ